MKNLPPVSQTIKANRFCLSDEVVVFTKRENFALGYFNHSIGEWAIDGHFRTSDYVVEWWPMPEIGTGNK